MTARALQAQNVSGEGVWGGPAFYDSSAGPLVYVQAGNAPNTAYTLATGSKPGLTEAATGTTNAGPGGSLPIVSSNGATDDTGVVWLIRRSNPVELEAYNAVALGTSALFRQCRQLVQRQRQLVPDADGCERAGLRAQLQDRQRVRPDRVASRRG